MKKRITASLMAAVMLMLATFGSLTMTASAVAAEKTADTQAIYKALDGYYDDSFSQRASMSVMQEEGGLEIWVHWSSSASETTVWNMHAVLNGDNKLEYTDCRKFEITFNQDDAEEWEEVEIVPEGFFTIEGGKLLWDGAAEESCKECVFEMPPEEVSQKAMAAEYAGVYQRIWVEEIAGTYVEHVDYIVLNEDATGCWIAQDVATLTWDEGQLMLNAGEVCDMERKRDDLGEYLLVYEFQNEEPVVYEKVPELPAQIAEMLPNAVK